MAATRFLPGRAARRWLMAGAVSTVCLPLTAAILPEERADLLYHRYDGGGVVIDGPSLLVRKQLGQSVSLSGNYYVDSITSASIDVVTTASPYREEREEFSLGTDLLEENIIVSAAYTVSSENDFDARTAHFSISQEMFANMTTVTLGFSRGWDTVGRTTTAPGGGRMRDPDFERSADRFGYRLGVTQILSKRLVANLAFDTTTDEGFLNNPYRQVRYLDPAQPSGVGWEEERYPETRTSRALGLKLAYYLPNRAALHGEYRRFSDSWAIDATNVGLAYVWPLRPELRLELHARRYWQSSASFFSDLLPYAGAQTYYGRDKELSAFSNTTLGFGVSYDLGRLGDFIDRGSINFKYDRLDFAYDQFRDLRNADAYTPGQEPLYNFSADVYQLYLSLWY